MKYTLSLSASHLELDLRKLKVSLSRGKNFIHEFVPKEERHITLFHLTEAQLDHEVETLLSNFPPLELKLDGVFAYPYSQEARLLWVDVQYTKELRKLRTDLGEALNLPVDEDYRPILPVVRLKNHRAVDDVISPFKNMSLGKVVFSKIVVMEMVSRGAFPAFKTLKEYDLKGKKNPAEAGSFTNHF
jgi:2'-5' RNA ligase